MKIPLSSGEVIMTAQSAVSAPSISDQEYKRRIRAWTLYDWANSAFATTILAGVLPFYYSRVAGATLPSEAKATQYWSAGLTISILVVAIISPILGTVSDVMRGKKKFLAVFMGLGVIFTGLLVLVDTGDWLMASVFFVLGRIGFGSANVFYDSLLPHVAREEDQDRVSTRGYAIGYLGGGLLLAINFVMLRFIPGTLGARLSFLSVAIWWAVFSIPILRIVPEPKGAARALAVGESIISESFARIQNTLREIRHFRELFKYLIAFLIYNDGIGIIIGIAVIYGTELGFEDVTLLSALLLVQFVGIPFSLVFGNLPSRSDKRQSMYLAFVLFNIVLLPVVGVGALNLLPQEITGAPSAAFEDTASAVGEGIYTASSDVFSFEGSWRAVEVTGEQRGAEEPDDDFTYFVTSERDTRYDFAFNGQKIKVTYNVGPDHGRWAVAIDGLPQFDDEGSPVNIDAYNATVRYDVNETFLADGEGEHVLTITNTGDKNDESVGTIMSLAQVEVMPPIRVSNLGTIIGLIIALQVVGLIFAFLLGPVWFKGLADKLDTKRSIMLALVTYGMISIWGFFLNSVIEFWFLAWMVAIVQGGSQALSRSLYASMSPPSMSGEFFGLFSIMSKFAGLFGPLFFIIAIQLFDSSRPGILSIIAFFIVGGFILTRVNVSEGRQVAIEKERELMQKANIA
jgi:UMF1 family MFS transporter